MDPILIGTVVVVVLLAVLKLATHFLIPIPILTWQQSDAEISYGQVISVKPIRYGIVEVCFEQAIQTGEDPSIGHIHFRQKKDSPLLPQVGEKIEVFTINRHYLLIGQSFNWVCKWQPNSGYVTNRKGETPRSAPQKLKPRYSGGQGMFRFGEPTQ